MDRKKSGAGTISDKNKREADDKIDKIGFQVEKKIARADGEHAPFWDNNKQGTRNPAGGGESDKDWSDAKKKIKKRV